ncbi:MAG TPA: hypothetical protein VFW68_14430 [Rhodocyclaceae bacterium]|nr:hypothetical protein [Rhodocyclaceae bacterium]
MRPVVPLDQPSLPTLRHLAEAPELIFYQLAIYFSIAMMDDPAMLAMWFC